MTARERYSAKRRSIGEVSIVVSGWGSEGFGAAPKREISMTSRRSRQSRTCLSARISSWRGVCPAAPSNAAGRIGQLGYGGVKPTEA